MAFRKKIKYLLEKYNPDVMLIQECEESSKFECVNQDFNILWIGDNKNKGLAVFARKKLKLEKIYVNVGEVKYLLAVKVDNVKILNFWAMDDKRDRQQRYIAQVWQGLKACKEMIDDYTIVAGDFNWNIIWDTNPSNPLHGKMIDVINVLGSVDIKSLYHTKMQEQFGKESQSTFFMYRKQEKKYHTDYVFVPKSIIEMINNFEIGEYGEWTGYSDHMPILFEIDNI